MSAPPALLLLLRLKPILPETEKLADLGVRIALTVLFAFLLQRALFLAVERVEHWMTRAGQESEQARQRSHTLGQIFRNLITVIVAVGTLIQVLGILGWDVKPLLAGAGILGVALGFGAQTLVRDVIAGVFILAENQFSVGDLIEIDGKTATVESLTVRATVLRDFNGFVHHVPNGEMKVVVNRSRGWNRLAVDAPVAASEDVDRALALCRRAVEALNADPTWRERLLEPAELWGVESLGAQENQVRMVLRARAGGATYEAARELRRRVHQALTTAGVRTSTSREVSIRPLESGGPSPPAGIARET